MLTNGLGFLAEVPAALQDGIDIPDERLGEARLDANRRCASRFRFENKAERLIIPGQHDDRCFPRRGIRTDSGEELETVNLRQDEVRNDQIGRGDACLEQRRFAVAALAHVIPLRPQRHGVHFAFVYGRIDEQDALDATAEFRVM